MGKPVCFLSLLIISTLIHLTLKLLKDQTTNNKQQQQQGGQEVQLRDSRYKVAEEVAHEFEGYGDYTISALGKNSLEQLETEIEDLVLCSNDVAPLSLLLSSKGWSIGQGESLLPLSISLSFCCKT